MRTILIQPKSHSLNWTPNSYDTEEDCIIICPFCGYFKDIYQTTDYVSEPMIWCCGYTRGCGARSVIDRTVNKIPIDQEEIDKIHNIDSIRAYYDTYFDELDLESNEYSFYYVELLYIKKCINYQLTDFHCNKEVSQSVIYKLIQYGKDIKLGEILKSNNITYEMNKEYEICKYDINSFNVALDIGSYNNLVNSSNQKIHDLVPNIDLSHDGINIYLLCINSKNELIVVNYWGD